MKKKVEQFFFSKDTVLISHLIYFLILILILIRIFMIIILYPWRLLEPLQAITR